MLAIASSVRPFVVLSKILYDKQLYYLYIVSPSLKKSWREMSSVPTFFISLHQHWFSWARCPTEIKREMGEIPIQFPLLWVLIRLCDIILSLRMLSLGRHRRVEQVRRPAKAIFYEIVPAANGLVCDLSFSGLHTFGQEVRYWCMLT